jgi:glucokinase
MYLGVDVGGTKTLVAALTDDGVISKSHKFPTPNNYQEFLKQLRSAIADLGQHDYAAAGVGIPATSIDRLHGVGVSYGNLSWHNTPIEKDLESLLNCPVVVENDAKMACLSEAMIRNDSGRVLYVTVSTGIGFALAVDCVVDPNVGDAGGRLMMLPYKGKLVSWESFASGRAIVERYHQMAKDITDDKIWQRVAHDLATGFIQLIAITEPDLIVVGGSVGAHFDGLKPHLKKALKQFETPLLKIPAIEAAKRPEEAVVYGCYDLAKQRFGSRAAVR